MKKHAIAVLSILFFAGAALCGHDSYPVATGGTQPRSLGGITFDGAFGNPALVGLDRYPRGGLSFPLFPVSFALRNDKLALPLNEYLYGMFTSNGDDSTMTTTDYLASYLTELFDKSFGVNEIMDAGEVSKRLTKELRDGIGLYTGTQISPLVFSTRGFALNARIFTDVDVRIPGGLLLPFFSETDGLVEGKGLDLSSLHVEAIVASEVAFKLGYSHVIPAVRDYLLLDNGAVGAGVKVILGHAYFDAKMDPKSNNSLTYNTESNKYKADAKVNIMSVGTGLHGDFRFDEKTDDDKALAFWRGSDIVGGYGPGINGYGMGLDFGAVFHNNRHMLSVDLQDIGMIYWFGEQVFTNTLVFDKEFDVVDLAENFGKIFDLDYSLTPINDQDDRLERIRLLPAALNVGYTYHYDLDNNARFLLGYLSASLNYRQQLLLGPGRSTYLPRLAAGGALGLLDGFLPVRCGMIVGGPERLASAAGIGVDLKYVSLDASYKAVGSPILLPEKGIEVAAALTFRWRWKPPRGYVKAPVDEAPKPEEPPPEPPKPEAPPLPEVEEPPKVEKEEEPVVYAPVEIVLIMHAPPPPPPPPQPTVEETKMLNTSQRAINFRTGGAELTPSSYDALNGIAELLKQYPHIRYEIQGHTDSQGADMYNLLLSSERAAAVKSYLVAKGAPEASLIAIGYGKNMPIANNATVEGRALNRRVEFVQIISDGQYETLKKFETEMMRNVTKRVFEGAK